LQTNILLLLLTGAAGIYMPGKMKGSPERVMIPKSRVSSSPSLGTDALLLPLLCQE
jgi:hypothetical protein